jgi:hypothetical protein
VLGGYGMSNEWRESMEFGVGEGGGAQQQQLFSAGGGGSEAPMQPR